MEKRHITTTTRKRTRRVDNTDFDFYFKSSSLQSGSSIQTTRRLATVFYLPNECWESIFKFAISDINSLSLVSKEFLSITNRLLFSLEIHDSTRPFLPRLFERFTNLVSINLSCYHGDMNALLKEISCFPLNITSLDISDKPTIPVDGLRAFSQNVTTLTSLTCSNIESIDGSDLSLIADCFPLLEELDLSLLIHTGMLENVESLHYGVKALLSRLFKLRKVNLSNHRYINDQTLIHLFKNCKLLEEVIIFNCTQITNAGIVFALRERPTLRSLSFSKYYDEPADNATFLALVNNGPSLIEISLGYTWKNSVENSNPLMDVVAIPQLKSLCLSQNRTLSDERIKIFVSLFPNLQRLNLSYCKNISEEGICQVLKRCRKIIHLDLTGCSQLKLLGLNFEVPKLEVLNLSRTKVDDKTLYVISKHCRGLLQLLLDYCHHVTDQGVKHVIENCIQLKEINLSDSPNVVASMVFSRPSWREITTSSSFNLLDKNKFYLRKGYPSTSILKIL